jgi:hypothetical protein
MYIYTQKLRKKSDGKGEMVSAFQDCVRGFGFPISEEELTKINSWRAAKYNNTKDALTESPGLRYLVYGKDVYWNYERFSVQVNDLLDCFECLYPEYQLALEVDRSSGHTKKKVDGLTVEHMNLGVGGANKPKLRKSQMTPGCLKDGGNPPFINLEYTKPDGTNASFQYPLLQVGNWQHFEFEEGDPPPFEDLNSTNYVGQPKGIRQVLFERGLFKKGMRGSLTSKEKDEWIARGKQLPDPAFDAPLVLSECEDFANEIGALQAILEARGHILFLSPACHPELAGCGVEYSWGKAKVCFRRETNDCSAKNLHANIINALHAITLDRVWRYERKTRDYRRMYADIAQQIENGTLKKELVSYTMLEKNVKKYKSHRSMLDIESKFIKSS